MEQKGTNIRIQNTIFQGSLSMMLEISSDGNWLMGVKKDTINSNVFARFMVNFDRLICDNHKLGYNDVLITLGNCSWHLKKLSLITLSKLNLKVMFLSLFSPYLVPVEQWFSFINNRLKLNSKDKSESLNKDS